ncbi:MAG: sulfur transferase domain-containing protein [Phormidium sp.]
MFQSVTESLAIGNVVSPEELREISQKGYKTIIDLCTAPEGNQLKAEAVEKLGFNLISIPVDKQKLTPEILPAFMQAVNSSPQPIYTRCASGLRAGILTLLTLAIQENWTEQQYLERRDALGIKHQPGCLLAAFAEEYFQVQSV